MKASGAFVGMTVVGDADGAAVEGDAVGQLLDCLLSGIPRDYMWGILRDWLSVYSLEWLPG